MKWDLLDMEVQLVYIDNGKDITNIENIKDMKLPEDSGSAAGAGTTDYGITSGIDYSDSQSVADAIDSSTPDDFGQSEGMVDGWED